MSLEADIREMGLSLVFQDAGKAQACFRMAQEARRLEQIIDDLVGDAMEDAQAPRTGNVIEFRRVAR